MEGVRSGGGLAGQVAQNQKEMAMSDATRELVKADVSLDEAFFAKLKDIIKQSGFSGSH